MMRKMSFKYENLNTLIFLLISHVLERNLPFPFSIPVLVTVADKHSSPNKLLIFLWKEVLEKELTFFPSADDNTVLGSFPRNQ